MQKKLCRCSNNDTENTKNKKGRKFIQLNLYVVWELERWMMIKFIYYTLVSLIFAGRCSGMELQMETFLQIPVERENTFKNLNCNSNPILYFKHPKTMQIFRSNHISTVHC